MLDTVLQFASQCDDNFYLVYTDAYVKKKVDPMELILAFFWRSKMSVDAWKEVVSDVAIVLDKAKMSQKSHGEVYQCQCKIKPFQYTQHITKNLP